MRQEDFVNPTPAVGLQTVSQRLRLLFRLMPLLAAGCIPNTHTSITDPYAYGVRWYSRGQYDRAAAYWDPLVAKGDCDAEYWVGLLYFRGQAKPHDDTLAIALWRKAANGNHPKAQAALGDLYYQNDMVVYHHCHDEACKFKKDLAQAYVWYKLMEKSARYDGEKQYAAMVLKAVSAEMSGDQRAQADSVVSQWKPTPRDCKPRHWWA